MTAMNTTPLVEITRLLTEAVNNNADRRGKAIRRFQNEIWNSHPLSGEEWAWGLLRDLAYDLDYYEPEVKEREDEASYFGEERCRELILSALKELQRGFSEGAPHSPRTEGS